MNNNGRCENPEHRNMPGLDGISRNMPEYHGTARVALSFTGVVTNPGA